MIMVLMGVSGSGKSTVGHILSGKLGWRFIEGDAHHPPSNVAKMSRDEPLTDEDRAPWLDRLNGICRDSDRHGQSVIVACSALKQSYRDRLASGISDISFVYLRGTRDIIADRLKHRTGHFMPVSLLDSQFDALEEPADGTITVDIGPSPATVASTILKRLGLRPQPA